MDMADKAEGFTELPVCAEEPMAVLPERLIMDKMPVPKQIEGRLPFPSELRECYKDGHIEPWMAGR